MLPGNQQKHLPLSLAHKRGKLNKTYNSTFSNTAQIAKFNEIHHSLANIRLSPPCILVRWMSLETQ